MENKAFSICKTPLESEFLALCDRILRDLGFVPVDVDCRVGGRSLIRVFIDRLDGTPPSIDDCSLASRAIGQALEAPETAGWFPGAYDLEVSSPGLDRRLRLGSDFERYLGSELKLRLTEKLPGAGMNLTGTLVEVAEGTLKLTVPSAKNEKILVPLPKVKQANVVWKEDRATRAT